MLCDKDSIESIQQYIIKLTEFLSLYTLIVDAYVSDYFTQHHWDTLPSVWKESLRNTEPTELVWLLTEESQVSRVWPLSLLAFRQCTRTYSLQRSQQEVKVQDLSKLSSQRCVQDLKTSSVCQRLANPDTKYHEYLRKHVKPKKLHEIKNLGKALRFLGDACDCEHIVDVGAGQGHLSRFMTFQHGFKVTTVEAEGCHAPKAQKYDRDAHRQISKGKGHTETESEAELPCHVTCYITADTAQGKFLDIIQESFNRSNVDSHCKAEGDLGLTRETTQQVLTSGSKIDMMQSASLEDQKNLKSCNTESNKRLKLTSTDIKCDDEEKDLTSPESVQSKRNSCGHIPSSSQLSFSNNFCDKCKKYLGIEEISTCVCGIKTNYPMIGEQTSLMSGDDVYKSDKCAAAPGRPGSDDRNYETEEGYSLNRGLQGKSTQVRQQFLLTGLHACGNLTPTMLRVFTSCPDIVGLASVGCCYMKMSTSLSSKSDPVGYPMSDFVTRLPHTALSYEAREMACHFADSYIERLKANPPSLKLHCYRAALQWIILYLKPDFVTGAQKLTIRKAEKLTFRQYVSLGLQRLGLNYEVPEEILVGATELLQEWRQVVTFYSLRLSLSPVVETLLLLDRQVYLYEQGMSSLLLPVFDPKISPRNFVLLAKK
ncbi:methyltransferase-like protein 25B [Saccostrea cucullata]|uniref:methyltransferase-like protein 25B n=1 Tax=Saccostrea cuccullata TaxID=36930 RepID=UPI002ED09565